MLTRARVVVLVTAALALAACGSVHPGDAAVVDGQSISMRSLDRTAAAYCTLTAKAAAQQGASEVASSDVRRQAVTSMVSLVVARKIARKAGVSVNPTSYELTDTQRASVTKAFPQQDDKTLSKAIEDSQEISAIAVALAAKKSYTTATADNESQLEATGQAEIVKAFPSYDVSFSPRFGLSPTTKAIAQTGSLSVPEADSASTSDNDLPASQRCS